MRDMKNKKLLSLSLGFLKWWYLAWLGIAALGFVLAIYYSFTHEIRNVGHLFLVNSVLLIKSFVYWKISNILAYLLIGDSLEKRVNLKNMSNCFLVLFCFDLISLFAGGGGGGLKGASQKFLEILPSDSVFYPIYSKVYLYLPAVFNFIEPRLEGISLIILSIILATLSRKEEIA